MSSHEGQPSKRWIRTHGGGGQTMGEAAVSAEVGLTPAAESVAPPAAERYPTDRGHAPMRTEDGHITGPNGENPRPRKTSWADTVDGPDAKSGDISR